MGKVTYHFPVAIGGTAYTVCGERVCPCEVAGFQVIGQDTYVYVRYSGDILEHPVLLSNICLSPEEAENKIFRKKEEQEDETCTDGTT